MKEKKNFSKRLRALFLLAVFLFQVVYPSTALALADGPIQPEFFSYEEPNATDMVNLVTGDFTANIPILEVPSPEGGFNLPLSYHAGIQTEEESSWVGLGWSLNPGAISRQVSQYADDYENKNVVTNISAAGGNGHVENKVFWTQYYDSQKGSGGTASYGSILTVGWGTQKGYQFMGVGKKDGYNYFDCGSFMKASMEVVSKVVSFGAASGWLKASEASMQMLNIAMNVGSSAMAAVDAFSSAGGKVNASDWTVETHKESFFKTTYNYYLDANKTEHMFGALYLNKIDDDGGVINNASCMHPFISNTNLETNIVASNWKNHTPTRFEMHTGMLPASDMHMNNPGGEYAYLIEPTSIAYDNYNVMGTGISGNISPYRLETGSLAYPTLGNIDNYKYNIVNYLDYKVNFKYKNENANSYTHHIGQGGSLANPTFGVDIYNNDYTTVDDIVPTITSCAFSDGGISGALIGGNPWDVVNSTFTKTYFMQEQYYTNWLITDNTITSYNAADAEPYYNASLRKEGNRFGLNNDHLTSGKFVQWYSNSEITSGTAKSNGFMDFLNDADRPSFRNSKPSEGIGGFSITREDGLTYYYTIPVYNLYSTTYFHTTSGYDYTIDNQNPFAYEWLLTGITGPDFVDRGTIGVIDDQDYGYWVKMDYGKFAGNYRWRNPYYGKNYTITSTNETNFTLGSKETYYLNKVSTRTHTALFVKGVKSDGKSYFVNYSPFGNDSPSSSLKLDDIILLSNKDYKKITDPTSSGGLGFPSNFNTGSSGGTLFNGDTYNNVLDNFDINNSPAVKTFLDQNQIKKIHFNYSYSLCQNTFNSFDLTTIFSVPSYYPYASAPTGRKGKLTLESVDILGVNNQKIVPPYLFNYGNYSSATENPNYSPDKWDGWGMYNSLGGFNTTSHGANCDGAQWSLKKLTSPIGAEMEITYERDSYGSVNGNATGMPFGGSVISSGNAVTFSDPCAAGLFFPGETITVMYDYYDFVGTALIHFTIPKSASITNIIGNTVNLSSNVGFIFPPGSLFQTVLYSVNKNFKYGGNIRVRQLTYKDEKGNSYKTQYLYTTDGLDYKGNTSGVCSSEPEFCKGANYTFYNYYDHPFTNVMYSKVTVLNGFSQVDNNYLNKVEYNFVTPHQNYLNFNVSGKYDANFVNTKIKNRITNPDQYLKLNAKHYQMNFKNYTSKIGSLISIKAYNKFKHLLTEVDFKYTDNGAGDIPNNMGIYTESTILCDRAYIPSYTAPNIYFRFYRTTKVNYPNILKQIDIKTNDKTISVINDEFDYLTGYVTKSSTVYPDGYKYVSQVIPAYKKYPTMGSKVDNINNKNMITQNTGAYEYVTSGTNPLKLLSANVTTWNNNWNYREFDFSSNTYKNASYSDVWRKHKNLSFKCLLNTDGTIDNTVFVDYNWGSSTQNPNWKVLTENSLFDHYSRPLEVKNIEGKVSSEKYGYNNSFLLASAANTNYNGWACSGAEDKVAGLSYFGGEVAGATFQLQTSSFAHTGNYCVSLGQGAFGFNYQGQIGTDFKAGEKYRASVWVHKLNAGAGELYFAVKDASNSIITWTPVNVLSPTSKAFGNWTLLTLDVTIPTASNAKSVEFGTWNPVTNALVYFDDFRVHPSSMPITMNVYDEKTGLIIATLDKENIATKYTYDFAGRLIRTDKETVSGFKKVSETSYNYGRP